MDSAETFVKLKYGIMTPNEYLQRVPADILVYAYKEHYSRTGSPCLSRHDQILRFFDVFGLEGCFDSKGYANFKQLVHQALTDYHSND